MLRIPAPLKAASSRSMTQGHPPQSEHPLASIPAEVARSLPKPPPTGFRRASESARERRRTERIESDQDGVKNVPLRALVAVGLFLLGFLFPLFFVASGLIAWALYEEIRDEPANRATRAEIAALPTPICSLDDIRLDCESPAEEAFLDAMILAYGLAPAPGALEGRGLRLRSQVGMVRYSMHRNGDGHRYRADFLVDEDLVVEIDGSTYHSSEEAVARDERKDADMLADGYSVLRIPASIVFKTPAEAIRRVEMARLSLRAAKPGEPVATSSS